MKGADEQRSDDGKWKVALRVLGLLAAGRDGAETDVGEEDDRGGGQNAAIALRRERLQVVGVESRELERDEQAEHRKLDHHHDVVEGGRLLDTTDQQKRDG
jgi:hypothetical protein